MVNILIEFTEVTETAAGSRSEVYQDMFWGSGNIINGKCREIRIWSNTINWKIIFEWDINCPIVVFSH